MFWEVLTKKFLREFMGLSNVTLGKDHWASPTAGKNLWSKGISLPDHLQRGEPSPPSQNGAGRAKKRRIWEETPNPGGEKGGRDAKRCRSPRMGWDWMEKTPEGFPPALPAQHQIKVTHDAHFPTTPSPPAPYSRDFSWGSPPQPSAVPSRPG